MEGNRESLKDFSEESKIKSQKSSSEWKCGPVIVFILHLRHISFLKSSDSSSSEFYTVST